MILEGYKMQTATAVVNHLKQEIEWIQSLNTLLSQEREFLIAREYHALEAISIEKISLSEQLERSTRERIQLMNPSHINEDPKETIQTFLAGCTNLEAVQINSHNKLLAEKLLICHDLNLVNGQVIATNLHTREELINTLTGRSVDNLNVYTATGNVKSTSGNGHYQEV
jgi:flagella synthesis protein FlgN